MSTNRNKKKKQATPQKQQIPEENIILLQDEDGNDVRFEILGLVEYELNNYAVLLPLDEPEVNEVTILKVEELDEETDSYLGIDNEELIQAVFEEFKKGL